jgi:hypothetical protein
VGMAAHSINLQQHLPTGRRRQFSGPQLFLNKSNHPFLIPYKWKIAKLRSLFISPINIHNIIIFAIP